MVRYGTCKTKTVFGSNGGVFARDIWVINDYDYNSNPVQTIGGTSGADGFNYIVDAISKAIEVGAPYTKSLINIILKPGYNNGGQ